jgi:hypothetical protein
VDEEVRRGREVVKDDADVVHPLDRQALDGTERPGAMFSGSPLDRIAPKARP